jgi:uncharacterized protein with ParB-like and HNH nuclease domain
MDVHKSSLLAVFDAKQRLEVPLFQRPYVWNEDQQWLPLWEDIERKFVEALEGRKESPHHFLGAMVLDQKQTPTGHVVVRQVIDGQQRLTTLQIFIAAYRDFCSSNDCNAIAEECDKFLLNTGMMSDEKVDKFKVWPTQADISQFTDVISARSRDEILLRYPQRKKPYARKFEHRPLMIEAYLFFFEKLRGFFIGDEGEEVLASHLSIFDRADECFQTLRNSLMVVVIDLHKDDDPQVIFETLNARGEPLLPADLLRNYIFLRVAKENRNEVESLYNKYWRKFDDEFWREEIKQGRLTRPRSDLFMQHFLASRQGNDIPIKYLYVEYRHWIESIHPFPDTTSELAALARQGEHFKRIVSPDEDDSLFEFCTFLETFDIRTSYPLLLALLEQNIDEEEWRKISTILESYLLRRAVCNLTTQAYNRIFLSLTQYLRKHGFSADNIKNQLFDKTGESGLWPNDAAFQEAWLHRPLYDILNSHKLIHILSRINQTFMSSKSENIKFNEPPTIEHIMPREWIANWRFADGSKGLSIQEIFLLQDSDARVLASHKRNAIVPTIGNLTILSSGLNSAQSNSEWRIKRPAMMKHSLLPINQLIAEKDSWDESAIHNRGIELFERALLLWPL